MRNSIKLTVIIITFFSVSCNDNVGENSGIETIVYNSPKGNLSLDTPLVVLDTIPILNDWERDDLKGNPKKMREEEFILTPSDEMGERTGENTATYIYNDYGWVKESYIYDNENNLTDYSQTSFYDLNKKERKIFYNNIKDKTMEFVYHYNRFGQNDSTEFIFIGKGNASQSSEYDSQGNEIKTQNYDFNNIISQTALMIYNNNNRVKTILKDANGIDYAISTYEYNEYGDPIKETYYSGNNIIFEVYKNIYTYDEKGNWISKKNYLEKIYFKTIDNQKREVGPYKVTLRTFDY